MAKTRPVSAAERRRQMKLASDRGPQKKANKRQRRKNQTWLVLGSILVLVIVVVGAIFFFSQQNQAANTTNTPLDAATLKAVTNADTTLLSQIGTGGTTDTLQATQGSPSALTGPSGKPELLYVGAEYCPYCAAERWSLITALSRFGTFKNLGPMTSSSTDVYPSTPTFTFYKSSYTSSYLDFVPVETADQQGQQLQTLTSDQQNLKSLYDAPPYIDSSNAGSIPFIDIGNRYLNLGASYDAGILHTNPKDPNSSPLSRATIVSQLGTNNALSKDIYGTANYLTAAICSITNNQPGNVCSDPAIHSIEASLPQPKGQSDSSQGSLAQAQPQDIRRPQD